MVPAAAGASSGWAIQLSPNPTESKFNTLSGVSCVSATSCTAVGYAEGKTAPIAAIAEGWNGKEWTLQTVEDPNGKPSGFDYYFHSVSCTSASACTAVGNYSETKGNTLPLVERWNGTAWKLETVASVPPKEGTFTLDELLSVSCSTSTSCVAVGEYTTYESKNIHQVLIESWNGTTWTKQTSSIEPTEGAALTGVACKSASVCTAVGYEWNGKGEERYGVPVAERFEKEWVTQKVPNPSEASAKEGGTRLLGVSCASSSGCTAVGFYYASTGEKVPLADAWNGTTWTQQVAVLPEGTKATALTGVSCTTVTVCTAVGEAAAVAENWNGTEWHPQTLATPKEGAVEGLRAVSCFSATSCAGVGSYISSATLTLVEGWSAPEWAVQTTANPKEAESADLEGVACTGSSSCSAVGSYDLKGSMTATAQGWKGTEWVVQTVPSAKEALTSNLLAVSCTTAAACTAVGSYETLAGTLTLAARWNGSTWTVEKTTNPAVTPISNVLAGVFCASSKLCIGVGGYAKNAEGTRATLAEKWNGTEWVTQKTPTAKGNAEFYSISCTSTMACIAVGYEETSEGHDVPLAESWNGTEWTSQKAANPKTATAAELRSVSCVTTKACTAVGGYLNGSGEELPVAESWNGSEWLTQTTPAPTGATATILTGVSCTVATVCETAGHAFLSSGAETAFADSWNGSEWALQTMPNPKEAKDSSLSSIACSSPLLCTGVGTYINSSGSQLTLGERYS
jgi:hypothetical protein